ncbi:hypothetical protein CPB84DRAFT_1964451 [Gymnopilus junonius]|uniref:DUF6533 domain-containing protein n=1 Tax=Gymnopilus junonius TaxID=109634 RepID=A0A9P5NJG6_GYMJU|nr:hypothetical protein CPB84DRAFT_1964451 [Gymnopilus junonius]
MLDPYLDDRLLSNVVDAAHSLHSRTLNISLGEQIVFKHAVVISTFTFLIYDYFCTLDREVAFVWSRPRTFGTYLFVLNRYLPFIDLTLSISALEVFLSPEGCSRHYAAIAWLNILGVTISQAILYLRTIAIWERNRWIMILLGTTFVTMLATAITATKLMLNSVQLKPANPNFFFGCDLIHMDLYIIVSFGVILVSETTVVLLTLIRALKHLRRSSSSWVHQLYKRGFLFYIYLLAVTMLNIMFPIFAPLIVRTVFTDIQRVLHSILCTRVIFIIMSLQNEQERAEVANSCNDSLVYSRSRMTMDEDGMILTNVLDTFATPDDR